MLSFNTDGKFQDNYKFLIGSIVPRPIAVISTLNDDGSNNLAPFSFFTAVSASPMIIAFCPFIKSSSGEMKDTVKNIIERKEFVVNFATKNNAEKINQASTELPYGEDEFSYAGLTPLDSLKVAPKRMKESPIHFECKLRDMISYGESPGAGRIITGEVLQVHVENDLYKEGRIDTQKFAPVGRGSGNDWFTTEDPFELERLMKVQIQK